MTSRIIRLVAEIDEFKGFWKGIEKHAVDFFQISASLPQLNQSVPQLESKAPGLAIRKYRHY